MLQQRLPIDHPIKRDPLIRQHASHRPPTLPTDGQLQGFGSMLGWLDPWVIQEEPDYPLVALGGCLG